MLSWNAAFKIQLNRWVDAHLTKKTVPQEQNQREPAPGPSFLGLFVKFLKTTKKKIHYKKNVSETIPTFCSVLSSKKKIRVRIILRTPQKTNPPHTNKKTSLFLLILRDGYKQSRVG